VITPKEHLLIWLKKRDVTLEYAKINNLHVMWSGSVINIHDDRDLGNVIF
jgi:hypothetical protein